MGDDSFSHPRFPELLQVIGHHRGRRCLALGAKEDGDLCNGVSRCVAGTCAVDPATPTRVRAILLAALAYFIMPVDMLSIHADWNVFEMLS